jgi:2-oxoglutarate ferredoxin oxidoreductase subunit beta
MVGLAAIVEEAIRFPGFAFVNVQSPCVTFGQPEQQLKAHKQRMEPLAGLGHDTGDRIAAMALAQDYGHRLLTGVFYRDPTPPPTYDALVRARQQALRSTSPRQRIVDVFGPGKAVAR